MKRDPVLEWKQLPFFSQRGQLHLVPERVVSHKKNQHLEYLKIGKNMFIVLTFVTNSRNICARGEFFTLSFSRFTLRF